MKYRTTDGQMLDEIAWGYYGNVPGCVEMLLEANRNIANYGPILPSGLVIELPNYTAPQPNKGIRLWD